MMDTEALAPEFGTPRRLQLLPQSLVCPSPGEVTKLAGEIQNWMGPFHIVTKGIRKKGGGSAHSESCVRGQQSWWAGPQLMSLRESPLCHPCQHSPTVIGFSAVRVGSVVANPC